MLSGFPPPPGAQPLYATPDCGFTWRDDECAPRREAVLACLQAAFDGQTSQGYALQFDDHAFTEYLATGGVLEAIHHPWDGQESSEFVHDEWPFP